MTGRRIGFYEVGDLLHDGTLSRVYRASDPRLDRAVALKLIARRHAHDEELRRLFVAEARHTAAVEHPHIVPVYDHGRTTDDAPYLVMRYILGGTFADLIACHPLPLSRLLVVGGQVAGALDAVHAAGLVHLDVKPANILVSTSHRTGSDAGGDYVYLADFGLARPDGTVPAAPAGAFLGSPAYAAPEHLRGHSIGPAADLYSLGCVLHTALTGRAPYLGTVPEIVSGHLTGGADQPPSRLRAAHRPPPEPGLAAGPATDAVFARALAADPADRPATAADLLAGLHAALADDASAAGWRGPENDGVEG
ncbi:serine/threonine protein kinase [Actinomycetospora endophytica]|uniref:non-specific serine/threonine protein kinase n=1 Tax=Actinomycetospora endophytica TaxID=2291215 RepID=A0ABS8P4K3_9PSEU|nr:serine/threonine-protein kinase [Actinomycetospora endophytica]MCD2191994.1 serine/threonine protein kinase [Actinomycetospora endophytica]